MTLTIFFCSVLAFCYNDLRDLSLQRLCRRIPGDAHLYSMFRLDSVPIECPFEGSFTFTYSRGKGVCQSPVSTIDTCIRTSQLVLHYQACYDVPGTESRGKRNPNESMTNEMHLMSLYTR